MTETPAPELETALLHSFAVLAQERHFGRAAERLHVTQPALSKRVQRLESVVGGPLLVRRHRAVDLTETGRVFLDRVLAVLREADRALDASRRALRGEAGRLRIGFGIASVAGPLPEVLLRFRQSRPMVHVEMRDMASFAQLQALRGGEIDLGFVRLPVPEAEFEFSTVLHERLLAVVGPRSAWREPDGLASLASQPFVVCSCAMSAGYHDHVMALCRAAGFVPRVAAETNELFSLLQLVRAGVGVALAPSSVRAMRVPGVAFRDVRLPQARWEIVLARLRAAGRWPLVDAFVDVARDVVAERAGAAPAGA